MYVAENKSKQNTKKGKAIYRSILLRRSYRENGKIKKETIANLSKCPREEIEAIKLALKYKDDLSKLGSLKESVELQEGLSVGAVWTVYQVAKKLGIEKALGTSFEGKLALWQVIARTIDQGSRLSAVRLANVHAACDVLGIDKGFDENNLYDNLKWLANNQEKIEDKLFCERRKNTKPELFLYDVTSSYLEGQKNAYGEFGYNRDGKKGKKQIVVGLLCDEKGEPVATEVFKGNTKDTETFYSQVKKAALRFGCERVTMVGDRGMIKSAQIEALPDGYHYITAITKPQIESLINKGIIQLSFFDKEICEVSDEGKRYILRRNPVRADEIAGNRLSKLESIEKLLKKKNAYLKEHKSAKVEVAKKEVEEKIKKLKVESWLSVNEKDRVLDLKADVDIQEKEALLDGCYVIVTDLPAEVADKKTVHERYKDLALVEKAFRTCKTVNLELRPIHVRTKSSTDVHVFVVMMSYLIIRVLSEAWKNQDMKVEEGLNQLTTLCSQEITIKGEGSFLRIPRPRIISQELLKALKIKLPYMLPHKNVKVVTRKKLQKERKTQ